MNVLCIKSLIGEIISLEETTVRVDFPSHLNLVVIMWDTKVFLVPPWPYTKNTPPSLFVICYITDS